MIMVQTTAFPSFMGLETDLVTEVSSSVSALSLARHAQQAAPVPPIANDAEKPHHLSIIRTSDPKVVEQAQRLRYMTFFGEQADSWPAGHQNAIDVDEFDQHCEHLVVLDHSRIENNLPKVVGTYRLRVADLQECRKKNIKLYTSTEFNLDKLMQQDGIVLELGRSCVHPDYRSGDVIMNLWSGLGEFLATNKIDYVIGCVSFPKAQLEVHKEALSYIQQYHLADESLRPQALAHVKAELKESLPEISKEEGKALFRKLPPLVKAYVRMGASFGEGAVLDKECDTLDVCAINQWENFDPRYIKRFIKA